MFLGRILTPMPRSKQNLDCVAWRRPQCWLRSSGKLCALVCCAALTVATAGLWRGRAQSAPATTVTASSAKTASAPAPESGQQQKPPTGNAEVETREPEITRQCSDLLKLATDLKAEVDKTTKDTLSVTVVRKANEIEQLAHKVRTGSPKG